jgi:hypothetical protein
MTPAEIAARQNGSQAQLAKQLEPIPAIAESLHLALLNFYFEPTLERSERLATALDGIRQHLLRIREALQREAAGGSPTR